VVVPCDVLFSLKQVWHRREIFCRGLKLINTQKAPCAGMTDSHGRECIIIQIVFARCFQISVEELFRGFCFVIALYFVLSGNLEL